MSTKFNNKRPAYVLPPWCLAPPLTPLPQIPFTPKLIQGLARLVWPGPGPTVHDWTRSIRDLPLDPTGAGYQEVTCGDEALRVTVAINWTTRRITTSITAYKAHVFQASTTWIAKLLPPDIYWHLRLDFGDTHIPLAAVGYLQLWV